LKTEIGETCAAHELALVVGDTLKNSWKEEGVGGYIKHIKSGRELAKTLHKQNNLLVLTTRGKNKPRLDVQTRYLT